MPRYIPGVGVGVGVYIDSGALTAVDTIQGTKLGVYRYSMGDTKEIERKGY